ncbi:glycoside hydrolase [Mycena alexandri]|uniref:Glycoside hydrolase n=1 Tax=Mycena alexandri TaxID=1745969 RepID=A0AAD6X9I2_9AGAR|nr:glycoside hydrolase [Mycena alexandri]
MLFFTVLSFLALSRAAVIPLRRSLNERQAAPKLVVAHFMVGNTFPYTLQDWVDDINLASASGLDAFALNTGPDAFQDTQTANAFQAAQQVGSTFKLFFSLDMSVLPCATADDGAALRARVTNFIKNPNYLQVNGLPLVSTFAGESCTFGQDSVPDGWRSQFAQHPDLQGQMHFVPSFFIDPATLNQFNGVLDGTFAFNSGWPVQVTTDFANGISTNLTGAAPDGANALNKFIGASDPDTQAIQGLATLSAGGNRLTYMAAVSPWFFTHFSPQTFNKNFIFLADQHLYSRRWESLIAERDSVDLVEVVTWNDFGESHYISKIKGALPPGSDAWVNGFPHDAFLDLTRIYATAFKTGAAPVAEKDQIFMWSRPHPANAQAPDPVGPPTTFQLTQDAVWAVVMATDAGSVTLNTSPTDSQTFDVIAGVNKLSIPISPGGIMHGVLTRNGQTVVELAPSPSNFTFNGSPTAFNYNIFVASASAA